MGVHIADLKVGELDSSDARILAFFSRKAPEYAVYSTRERVGIQFADAPKLSEPQRDKMARLSPLRSEINGLIDGWRSETDASTARRRAERYDRRTGAALTVAFEGDVDSAVLQLQAIKQDIIDERVASARFEYLIVAFATGMIAALFAGIATSTHVYTGVGLDIWRACIGGAIGAFFSIALAIRGRTVLPDLQRKANLMDAVLRVVIGIVGGGILVALVRQGFVSVSLGDVTLSKIGDASAPWLYTLTFGILAGFSERMVGDLLAKASATPESPPPPSSSTTDAKAAPAASASAADPASGAVSADAEPDPAPEQAVTDHCVSDVALDDHEVTPDDALPGAAGGVAKPEGSA